MCGQVGVPVQQHVMTVNKLEQEPVQDYHKSLLVNNVLETRRRNKVAK